jgi:hypothetical protein
VSGLARFSVTDLPMGKRVPAARQFRLTCPHGETTVTHVFGPAPADDDVLALLRARHEGTERCGCASSVTSDEARA